MTNPRRNRPAGSFHERDRALESAQNFSRIPRAEANICNHSERSSVFRLDELTNPPADKVTNGGYAHADDEHVEAGTESAAAREH